MGAAQGPTCKRFCASATINRPRTGLSMGTTCPNVCTSRPMDGISTRTKKAFSTPTEWACSRSTKPQNCVIKISKWISNHILTNTKFQVLLRPCCSPSQQSSPLQPHSLSYEIVSMKGEQNVMGAAERLCIQLLSSIAEYIYIFRGHACIILYEFISFIRTKAPFLVSSHN